MRLNLLLYLAIGVPIALCAHCPKGSVDSTVDGECVMAIDNAVTFNNAKQACQALGGNPIKIQNGFMNVLAAEQLAEGNFVTPAFIGVVRNEGTQQWTYVDGSPLTYNRWKPGSVLDGTNGNCAEMNSADVYWHPVSCTRLRAFICSFSDNLPDPMCGQNWTYSATFNACYYLQHAMRAPIWYYNLTTSLAACRAMGADLISIHSQQENDFVMDLIATHQAGIDCNYFPAFIGLTLINNVQAWTDGTPFNYDNRARGNEIIYGIINEPGCSTKWTTWMYNYAFQRFLCKKAPSNLHQRIAEIVDSLESKWEQK